MQSELRDIHKKLKAGGWVFDRSTGGHNIFKHAIKIGTIVVPGHWNGDRRLFKKILCDIKNGTKFERSQLGPSTNQKESAMVGNLSSETVQRINRKIDQQRFVATAPATTEAPTLPFTVAKGKPRGRTGGEKMMFSDEQILSAATIFEEGGTVVRAARSLRCSHPTAKKCLFAFFGSEAFDKLRDMTPKERRKAAREKAKAAHASAAMAEANKIIVSEHAAPMPTVALPKAVAHQQPVTSWTPPHPDEVPGRLAFSLSDISTFSATIVAGVASIELTMNMDSPSFRLLCGWKQDK